MSSTLFLNDAKQRVAASPGAILSILDSSKKNHDSDIPVIGILLGNIEVEKKDVLVKEAFPIITQCVEGEYKYNSQYLHKLIALLKRGYDLQVVGIYATKALTKEISLIFNSISVEIPNDLILMTVDTALTDNHLDIAAYSTPVTIDFHNVLIFTRFDRIPVEIEASEAEKIALAACNSTSDNIFAPILIKDDLHSLNEALEKLSCDAQDSIDKLKSTNKDDPALYAELLSSISAIPTMNKNTFDRTYGSNLDDMLLVTFLASLTRTQVALADNAIV